MSGKNDRKIRQYYRREVSKKAESMGEILGNHMKPKPKWIPWKAWFLMMGFFIKIKK